MSSDAEAVPVDLRTAVSPGDGGDAGVEGGAELRRFALAVVRRDEPELGEARRALLESRGPDALTEAAGVVAQFEAINRVADGTGILLDETIEQFAPVALDGVDLSHLRSD